MLKNIYIKNVKSFNNENLINLDCGRGNEFAQINTFTCGKVNLLKNILIYGANSSGKSNLINAVKLFVKILLSNYDAQGELIKQVEPFLFNRGSIEDTEFGINFIIEEVEYEYFFGVNHGKVVKEELYRIVSKKTMLFKRSSPSFKDIETTKYFELNKELMNNLREDVLFLTFTSFLNNTISNIIRSFFEKIYFDKENTQISFALVNKEDKIDDDYLSLIKLADNSVKSLFLHDKNLYMEYELQPFEENMKATKMAILFNEYASSGTKEFYRMIRYILYVLENGGVFIIDELDKHLHPLLTRKVIEMFNSIEYNKGNAQLICTVHDVTLLDENLRRDQIYFIDRDDYGISELYSLNDFKGIRKDNNTLKKYLLGQYGAVPKF